MQHLLKLQTDSSAILILPQTRMPSIQKKGNSKKIAEGDELLVQVIRDGLKTKLPALSGNLELPGQYLVLTGNDSRIGISGKLSQSTKERLKNG